MKFLRRLRVPSWKRASSARLMHVAVSFLWFGGINDTKCTDDVLVTFISVDHIQIECATLYSNFKFCVLNHKE